MSMNLPSVDKEFFSNACKDGLEFAKSCNFNTTLMLQTCERGDWIWWALRKANLASKNLSVEFAKFCAYSVKHLKTPHVAAACAAAYAAYAADAAAYAAADAADAANAERKKQADWLRNKLL